MQKEEIFKRIIDKAVLGGWQPQGILKGLLDGTLATGMETNFYKFILDSSDNAWYGYIFDIEFAKAVWGNKIHNAEKMRTTRDVCPDCGDAQVTTHISANYELCYEFHLRKLVIAEDKLNI